MFDPLEDGYFIASAAIGRWDFLPVSRTNYNLLDAPLISEGDVVWERGALTICASASASRGP